MEIISIPYLVYRKPNNNRYPPYMWICQVRFHKYQLEYIIKLLYFTVQAKIREESGRFSFFGYNFTKPEDSTYYISDPDMASSLYTFVNSSSSDTEHTPLPNDQLEVYIKYINHPVSTILARDIVQIILKDNKWHAYNGND